MLELESKLKKGLQRTVAYSFNSHTLVSLLSYIIQDHLGGGSSPHSKLSPPTFVTRLVNKIWMEMFSQFRFRFANKSSLCQIDKLPLALLPCHYHHSILVMELSVFHLFLLLNTILFYLYLLFC